MRYYLNRWWTNINCHHTWAAYRNGRARFYKCTKCGAIQRGNA